MPEHLAVYTARLGDRFCVETLLKVQRREPHCLALAEFKVQWEDQVESCLARPEDPSRRRPRAELWEMGW